MRIIIAICLLCMLLALPPQAGSAGSMPLGMFVTVLQTPQTLSSRDEISKLIAFAKKAQIEMLFVQVYRANQSWFPSKVADQAPYEACLKSVSEDPFALLITQAHAAGIEVHAWLNLLSLSKNKDAPLLKKYGTGILTRNLKKKSTLDDYKIDDQFFLEPGDLRTRNELSAMVEELLTAYPDLDGVQFDYIRYPDRNPAYGYTKMNVERFKKATALGTDKENTIAWKNWKRDQVTGLLKQLVKKARSIRPGIKVSTTGCAPYSRAYHEAFQDWPFWIENNIVDFVTVMSYSTDLSDFQKYIMDAKTKTLDFNKVNIAIGAYELIDQPDKFARQLSLCSAAAPRSCVIFHYGSLLQNSALSRCLTTALAPARPDRKK